MINSVTNNSTKHAQVAHLHVWIDHIFTTWFKQTQIESD